MKIGPCKVNKKQYNTMKIFDEENEKGIISVKIKNDLLFFN